MCNIYKVLWAENWLKCMYGISQIVYSCYKQTWSRSTSKEATILHHRSYNMQNIDLFQGFVIFALTS